MLRMYLNLNKRRIVMAENPVAGERAEELEKIAERDIILDQLWELERQLRQRTGYPFNRQKLRCRLADLIEGRLDLELYRGIPHLFISPEEQLAIVKTRNIERGWG